MTDFEFHKTKFDEAYLITPFSRDDNRGSFTKHFEKQIYGNAGISMNMNEIFTSVSHRNVIRGMHFQTNNPQIKLVSIISGSAVDVIVDIRKNSPTYGQWQSFELDDQNKHLILIPRGFAHGFVALEDNTVMLYQCDGKYDSATDTGIRFDDSRLDIRWPIDINNAIVSGRDRGLMSLDDYEKLV